MKNNLKVTKRVTKKVTKTTIYELMEKLKMSESGIKKVIKKLKDENRVQRVGGLKDGRWEVVGNDMEDKR